MRRERVCSHWGDPQTANPKVSPWGNPEGADGHPCVAPTKYLQSRRNLSGARVAPGDATDASRGSKARRRAARLPGRCERRRELAAGADLELAVDAREVHLDRLHRDEERLRDLLVAVILRGQLGDAALAGGQRVDAADDELARARARGGELLVAALDERGAPARCASSTPSRRRSRASLRWLPRRSAAPSSTSARACSSRAFAPARTSTASRSSASPSSPPRSAPARAQRRAERRRARPSGGRARGSRRRARAPRPRGRAGAGPRRRSAATGSRAGCRTAARSASARRAPSGRRRRAATAPRLDAHAAARVLEEEEVRAHGQLVQQPGRREHRLGLGRARRARAAPRRGS